MDMRLPLSIVACLSLLATVQVSVAQAPRIMAFSGQLTNNGGTPVPDANYAVEFALYDTVSMGTALWTELHPAVATKGGVFNVALGLATPFPKFTTTVFKDSLWIGIAVGADPEMTPRSRLAAAPYAMGLALPIEAEGSEWSRAVLKITNTYPNSLGQPTAIEARNEAEGGRAVHGWSNAATGFTAGVSGETSSTDGRGTYGIATAVTGLNYGVFGRSNSNTGYGVWGQVSTGGVGNAGMRALSATTGISHGIWATAQSPGGGIAVFANHTAGGYAGWFDGKVRVIGHDLEINVGTTPRALVDVSDESFKVYNDGVVTIELDADYNGDGRVITEELQITGGADLSEFFDVISDPAAANAEPGMVVSIDRHNPGKLRISDKAYDRMVAGVISGAGDVKTGLLMGQDGSLAAGATPVALVGRVFVKADARSESIEPGDLLTTSSMAGHVMRASDSEQAQGAVIGKAMSSLGEGTGLVLVLISLQ
jgi:hypothetical protein